MGDEQIIAELERNLETMRNTKEQLAKQLHDLNIQIKDKAHARLLLMGRFHAGGRKKKQAEKVQE